MRSNTSADFNTALTQTVTATGYLVQLTLPGSPTQILRWCDIGTVEYDGQTWQSVDMRVQGYGATLDAFGLKEMTLDIQNLDDSAAAYFLATLSATIPVIVWQMTRTIGSPSVDGVKIAQMAFGGAEIGFDFVKLKLLPTLERYAYAPWRRVDAANGLANATPEGTRITWGNEIFILENRNG